MSGPDDARPALEHRRLAVLRLTVTAVTQRFTLKGQAQK
jgi:hypothetical protein